MAFLKKLNTKAKTQTNTGFGNNASNYGGRFLKKDGRANITKKGVSFFEGISWYHSLLAMPGWKFFSGVFIFYIVINLFFACLYYAIGPAHLTGMHGNTFIEKFGEAFFFSAQTFTTVGYGRVNPIGFAASAVAAIEALIGLLSLALATGLLYGRFSKPTAYLKFSKNAVLSPFKGGIALMLRVAPYKNTILSDAEVKISVAIHVEEDGKTITKFFPLDLEVEKVNALTLNWTIVHPINENSPFYKFTATDFANAQGEILVFIKAFDDMFSNTVVSRSSYRLEEVIVGAKFVPMYYANTETSSTVLDLTKLDEYIVTEINFL
jgi:inward rectifier potassium channel